VEGPLPGADGDLRLRDPRDGAGRDLEQQPLGLAGFSLATFGFYGMKSPFWPLPSTFLIGAGLAAGLAFFNSIGNFAGYLGPIAVGYTKDATGTFEAGIYVLAGAAAVPTLTALGCALWMPKGAVARVAVAAE
jgi:hypothetical protein